MNFQSSFSFTYNLESSDLFKMNRPSEGQYDRSPFPKRSKTLLRKASELAEFSDADVYLLLAYRNEAWEYNSSTDSSWPPMGESLVGIHEFYIQRILKPDRTIISVK